MKRRAILRAGLGTLGTVAVPSWMERAFAQDCCSEESLAEVTAAFGRARQSMLPLLVLIVPPRENRRRTRWMRESWFADWLLLGGDEPLALLALVEVVATTPEHLSRIIPSASAASVSSPLMVLVETGTIPASAFALDAPLETIRRPRDREADRHSAAIAESNARNEILTRLLRDALLEPVRFRREGARVRAWNATTHPLLEYERYLRSADADRASIIGELVNRARARWIDGAIPGASWRIPDVPECGPCGIVFTPARSARFLRFYVQ